MGYFTLALARLVGPSGTVIAADLQAKMLSVIENKAERAGLKDRIILVHSSSDRIGIERPLDFALAFWMVHEVPDRPRFFKEIVASLKKGGLLLLVEPRFHVSRNSFAESLGAARDAGMTTVEQPSIFLSRAALLKK
jgi:ubiquinone/menaquinone biosynthesis C-methylase UbiE